ncbi:MAG: WG repeat-containing protein [Candidatus Obscuribacter sp.]|nr:WG repeat-containing protein [Candidatus Obscuribacter sp.]
MKLSKQKRWGFIDKTGAFVIPPQYELVQSFSDET